MSEPIQSIAQNNYILATQQEVSHDNTLSGNGTVDSPLGVVPGYNETVLYSGDGTNLTLSEDAYNFERLRFKVDPGQGMKFIETTPVGTLTFATFNGFGNAYIKFFRLTYDSTTYKFTVAKTKAIGTTFDNNSTSWAASIDGDTSAIKEIVGINRLSTSN